MTSDDDAYAQWCRENEDVIEEGRKAYVAARAAELDEHIFWVWSPNT